MAGSDLVEPTKGAREPVAVLPESAGARSELAELTRQWSLDALQVVDTPRRERFDRITRLAKQVFGVDNAAISLIDHDRQWFKSHTDPGAARETTRDESFCAHTIQRPEGMIVPDAREDRVLSRKSTVIAGSTTFYAGVPLLGPGGERVGALCVFDAEAREFTDEDWHLLQDLARWVQDELASEMETSQAMQVQQGLLPAPLVSLSGYQVAGACRPVREISGDFYDWYPISGGAAFTLGGVMARSVVGGVIAATVRATMRASSRFDGAAAAVESAADTLDADLSGAGVFVTLFHSCLDEDSGALRYVDAGHGLSVVAHADGRDEHLAATDTPLGSGWENSWPERTTQLRPGDVLVSVSDGVLDALGGTLEVLTLLAGAARSSESAAETVAAIIAAAAGSASDDLTVLVVRRDEVLALG